ncbi:hypothetical protein ABIB40_000281 [Pedobacter sp. UYP30]|uniref:hypothetical protein n=1 Tax=Pedobacter sp. UYP30 TaxID=1756400 RepID=UPI003394D81F
MNHDFNWNKDTFDSKYQVLSQGLLKYALNFESWHNSAIATTQTGIYLFKTQGLSKAETLLLNNRNEVLAVITFNWLALNATIKFTNGDSFKFLYQRNWITEWSLNNGTDKQVFYKARTGSGMIKSNVDEELTILTGLYIREYFSRLLFLIIGVILIGLFVRGSF